MIEQSIFRAYDIRGVVGETLTEETVYLIGKGLASLVLEKGGNQVVIARDGRISGPVLLKALSDGILSTGCNVIDLGMVPTPLLYFATHTLEQHSGVMLTGSHNPSNYNGLKMVVQGSTIKAEEIQQLYQRIVNKAFAEGQGVRHEVNITPAYIEHIKQTTQLERPLKIVIDGGNGVTGKIAPQLFRLLGCEVEELFCEIDGSFPNHHPDPSQPENLQDLIAKVQETQADVGLAFDGDGDRLGIVTSAGEIIWPDRLLMLYAQSLLKEHPQAKIIYDVKCTHHLGDAIKAAGGIPLMWKTGHSFIKAKMAEIQAQLAGEMSGHFFFKDRWFGFDDALYAGVRLLEILSREQRSSAEVFAEIPNSVNTPELKVLVDEKNKFQLMQRLIDIADFKTAKEVSDIDGLRVNFADGWGLVRPSNTTPYLVLRFEAVNITILSEIQNLFRDWMLSVEPGLELPF